MILIGLIIPAADIQIYLGGAKLTVGRLCVILLMVPALGLLFQRSRKFLLSDILVAGLAGWILLSSMMGQNSEAFSSAVAECLEFSGAYVVARGFFLEPGAMRSFISVLKILTLAAVLLAMADSLSGKLIVHDVIAKVFGTVPPDPQYRNGMVRATSTFDHAILLGAFCATVGTVFLFSEKHVLNRILWVGICLLGCILSFSSSGILAFVISFCIYCYNAAMRRYAWRWTAFWILIAIPTAAFFAAARDPMGWIVSHLTLDPESGYFRFLIWDAALDKISQSPIFGFGVAPLNNWLLDVTVDSAWLVFALRFGVPFIALLLLANIAAFAPTKRSVQCEARSVYMADLSRAFTVVLFLFIFIGLTVHFWNYMWIFWGLCIGLRASLREWSIKSRMTSRRPLHAARGMPRNLAASCPAA